MNRLLTASLALAGLGLSVAACHAPDSPVSTAASPAPSGDPAAAAAPATPVAPTVPSASPVTPTASAVTPQAAPAAAPAAPHTVRRATAAEAALVAGGPAARAPRLSAAQREAQREARRERADETREKAERIARYGSDVPEAGEREEHHDARERAEAKADGFDEPDQYLEYERRIRARIGGQPEYGAGYRVEAAQALDATPASRAAQGNSAAIAAQGITAIAEVGPGNVSGRTRVISPDPASPLTTWLVAGVDGGFWKTSNAGTTWTHVAPYLDYLAFASIARSPRDPNVLYAGTGEGFGNSDAVRGDGIFRSSDRGNTWTLLGATNRFNGFSHTNRLVVFGTTQDTIVAATNTAIFRSIDDGASWQQVYQSLSGTTPQRIQQVISNPLRPRTLYATVNAGVNGRVIRSGDGGTTWATTNLTAGTRVEIALAPSDTTHLYAQVEQSATVTRYYRSVNAGSAAMTWTQLTGATTNVLNGQGWYDNALTVDPLDKNRVYVAGVDVYRLTALPEPTNTGMTLTRQSVWSNASTAPDYAHADHHVLMTVPNGGGFRLINGSDGGVAYTDNIGTVSGATFPTWVKTLNAYNTAQPYSADKRAAADQFVTGLQDNGTWVSPNASTAASAWNYRIGGDGFDTAWNQADGNLVMGSLYYNRLFRSTDGGVSFAETSTGLTEKGTAALGPFTTRLFRVEADPNMLYVGGKTGPWRSEDFGGNWTKSTLDVASRWYNSSPVSSMIVASPANPDVVYAGNAIIGASGAYTAFRSTDAGNTFASLPTTGMEAMAHFMTNMATHPTDANTAYILFSAAGLPKIFRTQNAGQTWSSLTGTVGLTDAVSTNGFPNVATYSMLQMPYDPNTIWVGTEIGLVVSTDGGATWARPAFTFPNVAVRQMRISDDKVIVATHGRGVFTVQLSELATSSYVVPPSLQGLAQSPAGAIVLAVTRPMTLDSLVIRRNSQRVVLRPGNTGRVEGESISLAADVVATRVDTFVVVGYRGGVAMTSRKRTLSVSPAATPVSAAGSNFNNGSDPNFTLSGGATFATPAGFVDGAIHSAHNYAANTSLSVAFNKPITLGAPGSAMLEYDEIAILEPCGATCLYDYTYVEATKDGSTWIRIAGPFDASSDAAWSALYPSGSGNTSLFRHRSIDLLAVQAPAASMDGKGTPQGTLAAAFAPGDVVLVRWRMLTDGSDQGWGWALDNVSVQGGALPVELVSFTGAWDRQRVRLAWNTASETNNAAFAVERRIADGDWAEVGRRAGAGTVSEARAYTFVDAAVPFAAARLSYRLRQIDLDGTAHVGPVVEVAAGAPEAFSVSEVSPNPVRGRAVLRYAIPAQSNVRIEMYDVAGRLVSRLLDAPMDAGRYELPIESDGLSSGVYLVRVTAGRNTTTRSVTIAR